MHCLKNRRGHLPHGPASVNPPPLLYHSTVRRRPSRKSTMARSQAVPGQTISPASRDVSGAQVRRCLRVASIAQMRRLISVMRLPVASSSSCRDLFRRSSGSQQLAWTRYRCSKLRSVRLRRRCSCFPPASAAEDGQHAEYAKSVLMGRRR